MKTVAQIMTTEPRSIRAVSRLVTAAKLMNAYGIRHLPVVGTSGALVGIARDYDVFAGMRDGREGAAVSNFMVACKHVVRPEQPALDVLVAIVTARQDAAVVVDEHRHPVGIFTEHDGLDLASVCVTPWTPVGPVAGDELRVVATSATVAQTLRYLRKHHIRHIPVVEDDMELAGVLSWRDLRTAVNDLEAPVGSLVEDQVVCVASPETTLLDASRTMYEHKIGCLPIVEHTPQRLIGILTRTDVLRLLVDQLTAAR